MYLNDFSVRIPEGRETPGGYVELKHGEHYTLVLRNSNNVPCDATVNIDGKTVGVYRVGAHRSWRIERPVHDDGLFTFYRAGSQEAIQAQLNPHSPDFGLVSVTFVPEYTVPRTTSSSWVVTTDSSHDRGWTYTESNTAEPISGSAAVACNYFAGGTGLSGHSDQKFKNADYITLDYSRSTTIHLRLVGRDDSPRPLTSYSTPVPPRVG